MRSMQSCAVFVVAASAAAHAGIAVNGMNMNGMNMNGMNMNGIHLNGMNMNGMNMNGVSLDGVAVQGVTMSGSLLHATLAGASSSCAHSELAEGAPLAGACSACAQLVVNADAHCGAGPWDSACVADAQRLCSIDARQMVGAVFTATLSDGSERSMRLDGVRLAPDPFPDLHTDPRTHRVIDRNNDVWEYAFSWWQATAQYVAGHLVFGGSWQPLCGSDRDNEVNQALAVGGTWLDCQGASGCGGKVDNAGFTLACKDVGAIAKCVQRLQYKPWRSVIECNPNTQTCHDQSLDQFHQACVRMLRADFCGDGTPHTVDGHLINVGDGDHLQSLDPSVDWPWEAGWSPGGASCITSMRYTSFDKDTIAAITGCWPLGHPNGDMVCSADWALQSTWPHLNGWIASAAPAP